MEQTALQQAINELRKRGNLVAPRSNIGVGISMAINTIKEFIDKEKQQMIDAFESGYNNGYDNKGKSGFEYVNETFEK